MPSSTSTQLPKASPFSMPSSTSTQAPKAEPSAPKPPQPPPTPKEKPQPQPKAQQGRSVSRAWGRLDSLGETPLITAVRQGIIQQVERLLDSRADPEDQDRFGETALMEAAASGEAELCSLLLQHCADPNYRSPSGFSASDLATEHTALASVFRDAPLWLEQSFRVAAGRHDFNKVDELLKRFTSLDPSCFDAEGDTALHVCAARPAESAAGVRVAKRLIEGGACVNAANLLGETPVMLATRGTIDAPESDLRLDILEVLLGAGATVNTSDHVFHETALMEAASIGDPELVLLLLEARADTLRSSSSGHTAVDFAGSQEVEWMLRNPKQAAEMKASLRRRPGQSTTTWGRSVPNIFRQPPPPPEPRQHAPWPPPGHSAPSPEPAPSSFSTAKLSHTERIMLVLERYPGFEAAGLSIPAEAWSWTIEEVELFVGSLGQLWPHTRRRASTNPAPKPQPRPQPAPKSTPGPKPAARPSRPQTSALRPYYQVLGLPEGTSDKQAIKRAYRQAALKWHPDKNFGSQEAAQRFQQAREAFENLCEAFGIET